MVSSEEKFTSTGIKFWLHSEQMTSYRDNTGNTIISTHISPEGRCNLNCQYCSVTNRQKASTLQLNVIKDYVIKLQSRGLQAVILTGGGEPTLYKNFNELVRWLKLDRGLKVALITNGTMQQKVDKDVWRLFTWIRVSINKFSNFKEKISIPLNFLDDECILGCSYVCSNLDDIININDAVFIADKLQAKYVRVLPNCLMSEKSLMSTHDQLNHALSNLNDDRFFRQNKVFKAPNESICHQSYFRPYLSEAPWHEDGIPGAVYPCDSVVLNDAKAVFDVMYQLCKPENILDFLDKKISPNFVPHKDCKNCVFFKNIEMLGEWSRGNPSDIVSVGNIIHKEFV